MALPHHSKSSLHLTHCGAATPPFFLFLERESLSYFKASELFASPGILVSYIYTWTTSSAPVFALIQLLRWALCPQLGTTNPYSSTPSPTALLCFSPKDSSPSNTVTYFVFCPLQHIKF